MRKLSAFLNYLLRSLYQAHSSTLLSDVLGFMAVLALTLTACMVLFFLYNFRESIEEAIRGIDVLAFTSERPSEQTINALREEDWVEDVKVYSSDDILREDFSAQEMESLKNAGVRFPWIVEVEVKKDIPYSKVTTYLERVLNPIHIDTGQELSKTLLTFSTITGALAVSSAVLFLLGIGIVVAGGVRSNILLETQKIEVLRLVGATKSYIAFPYVFKQLYMTAASVGVGIFVFRLLISSHALNVREFEVFFSIVDLPFTFYAVLLATGVVTAAISSHLTLRRLL